MNTLKFYNLCDKLKSTIDTTFILWGTKRRRLESIADHIYGSEMLAIAIYYQFSYAVDLAKVIMMLAIHELDKIELEDVTFFRLPDNSKEVSSHRIAEFVLKDFFAKEELISLLEEYDSHATREAKFAYQVKYPRDSHRDKKV